MSIRSRLVPYALRVMRGEVRPDKLVNLAHSRILPKTEIVSWQPTHLSIFVTDHCNFCCDMCPTHSLKIPQSYIHRHHPAPDMSLDLLRSVLDRYPNTIRVQLIGTGEPLLNPHFFELVRESTRRHMIVDTVSNGYALGQYTYDLRGSGLDTIGISVNGHTADEFHRMTGNPKRCHSRILQNVEALVRACRDRGRAQRIVLSFIIDRYNYRHMRDMIELGENLGADAVVFYNFLPCPYAGFTPEERCLYADDPAVREELTQLMSMKFRCKVTWPYLLKHAEDEGRTVCRWPFTLLQVDGAGNVGGCPVMVMNMHDNGKVYDRDPWNNQFFRNLRARHLRGDLLWPCKSCCHSIGVKPSGVIKSKLSLVAGRREGVKNTVACHEKRR